HSGQVADNKDDAGYAATAARLRGTAACSAADGPSITTIRLEAHYILAFRSCLSTLRRMSLPYADEAIHLREVASLSDRDIARATGSGVSTVSAWLRRERAPRGRPAR